MKKHFALIPLLLVALVFALAGCSQSGSGGIRGGEKIRLEMKPEVGSEYKLVNRLEQDISTSVMGMSQDMKQKMEFYFRQVVTDVNDKGESTLAVTYERIVYQMDGVMDMAFNYDSDHPDSVGSPIDQAFAPLKGATFTMITDKYGKIVDLQGLDTILNKMSGDGAASQVFDAENLKKTMQGMLAVYPDVLVGEGDTWGATTDLSGQYPMSLETTYKVEKIEKDAVFLNVDGSIASSEGADLGGMGTLEIEGNQAGTLEIARETGMVISANFTQDIEGEMKIMGMSSPLEISSKIIIEPY